MSNVSYDLDTSGGLMPLIRALIKPPDEETPVHKPKKHPYYKRPGKGHNHDCCDACGEGGDLICCDRCPASFHLGCYDPPLDENDIPAGLWLCKQCRGSDAEKPTSSRSSRAQSPADRVEGDKKSRSHRKKTKEDAKEKEKDKEGESEKEFEKAFKEEKEVNPMEVLVKAAKIMNPKQFELPREMQIPCPFPGTEKVGSKTGNATVITTDGSGCVPLPAKTCHVCTATCKKAPLLQCDYCPLLFHQDCLDPPLTALPTGRWMCPNHVEQYIDWKLVKSVSATERVALWDKFSGPVDQHAIKVDFIRRARGNRPFRWKVPVGARGRVCVPDMVRQHYRRPPPLLPSRREFVRCAKVLKQLKASGTYDESEEEGEMTEESKHKICMNMSCPQYSGEGQCPLQEEEDGGEELERVGGSDDGDSGDSEEEMHTAEIVEQTAEPSADQPQQPTESAELPTTEEQNEPMTTTQIKPEPITESFLEQCSEPTKEEGDRKRKADDKPQPKLRLRDTKAINQLMEIAEEQLKDLDMNTIKILAYQMMQQIAASEGIYGRYRNSKLGTWASRAVAALGRRERASLQRLGLRLMPLPSELLPAEDRRRIAQHVYGAPDSPAQPMKRTPGEELADSLVRAAFCPVNLPPNKEGEVEGEGEGEATLGAPVAMRAGTFRVGSARGCDLQLPRACRRVSAMHALVFCDQVTQHYELINYSPWGTCVNGTLYAVDVSPRASEPPEQARSVPYRPLERYRGCRCPRGAGAGGGAGAWEGGALLPHASLLQFGCQMYVFSLLDGLRSER